MLAVLELLPKPTRLSRQGTLGLRSTRLCAGALRRLLQLVLTQRRGPDGIAHGCGSILLAVTSALESEPGFIL